MESWRSNFYNQLRSMTLRRYRQEPETPLGGAAAWRQQRFCACHASSGSGAETKSRFQFAAGWGRVIFLSSQSGLVGIPGQPVYCSTKGAVIPLVRTLGVEWARHGITVNSVAPTFVETNLTRERLQQPEFRKFVLNKIPVGKLAGVHHVAAAVAFLASDEAAMVNCHTLCVDGGWTAW